MNMYKVQAVTPHSGSRMGALMSLMTVWGLTVMVLL